MLRCVVFLATTATVFSLPKEKRQVRIGMVPIFDARITNEPITFTFTTVPPTFTSTSYPVTSYPVQIKGTEKLPTLIPMDHKESYVQTNYNNFNEKWQYTPRPQLYTTSIYNQAQYFSGYGSNKPVTVSRSPYDAAWTQIGDSWHQMKSTLAASGIERDWRQLWGKLTGAVEPFMSEFSEQLGKMVNIFLRQQQSRLERETPKPSGTSFWLFRGDRQQQNLAATSPTKGDLGSAAP
ncbi:unnamed protein product [Cylicocyclus nassatus]|uniref:Uncharacterized protein n=1 Tax=Cylicocyclus nassatus TaxID=53992 RepID=A0AA36DN37_CYLNA|nr:unnamed protein product [Cylicocyclus nassatus]